MSDIDPRDAFHTIAHRWLQGQTIPPRWRITFRQPTEEDETNYCERLALVAVVGLDLAADDNWVSVVAWPLEQVKATEPKDWSWLLLSRLCDAVESVCRAIRPQLVEQP